MELINGDCLEELKKIDAGTVDLVICDLPYGCLKKTQHSDAWVEKYNRSKTVMFSGSMEWDSKIDLELLWKELKRVVKTDKTPILFFCNTRYGNEIINSNPEWYRYDLVWNKTTGTNFLRSGKSPMTCHEMMYLFSKKMPYYNKIPLDTNKCPVSVINVNQKRTKLHPTAKPIELYEWLISRYSNEGDTILDPTAGSFNSARASMALNRKYIGIELNKAFFDKNTEDLQTTLRGANP